MKTLSLVFTVFFLLIATAQGQLPEVVQTEGQPLGANIVRVLETLEYLGHPLSAQTSNALRAAAKKRDARLLQKLLDEHVLFVVSLNPEVRVKVSRGPARANLQQSGFTPHIVKVINNSTVTRQLNIDSPQAGPVYARAAIGILERQAQTELLRNENVTGATDRFLELEMYRSQPMTAQLSGLEVEYAIALIYCSESGKREATISFNVGDGTQDIGFRGQVPVLFDVKSAHRVRLQIRDSDGSPTTARLTFKDQLGHVFPPQMKRLAPDFFFQPQVYRADGDHILLPSGKFAVTYCRGPEYEEITKEVVIDSDHTELQIDLKRWVNPMEYGFFCGDHHIHGAGCSHYESPTEGVEPAHMFAQVKGEGLNVGCVLTWGPCFDYQRRFFSPVANELSEPLTKLKYDLEISGFGSAALGHVCLLRLQNQTYPGSDGTKLKGWPTWTVPVLRWAKQQGGVTGYPHSALHVNPTASAKRFLANYDRNNSTGLAESEVQDVLLPRSFAMIDSDMNGELDRRELTLAIEEAANELPNYCVPEMNGAGAMEICVSTAEGVCDFISAMDTERIPELNTWYHLMNCGFPLKLSGETDFPCMSSRRVGQGRVYVQMGKVSEFQFDDWCEGLQLGRSYVSDGFAHALKFAVNGIGPGTNVIELDQASNVRLTATVAFAQVQPRTVAQGGIVPAGGRRVVGDTRLLHAPRDTGDQIGGKRLVEVVVNGQVVDSQEVEANGKLHHLDMEIPIEKSSWVAIRQFPQLHTNPVSVVVGGKPIRANARSARWCVATIDQLWKNRKRFISKAEQPDAEAAYSRARARFDAIAIEASTQ